MFRKLDQQKTFLGGAVASTDNRDSLATVKGSIARWRRSNTRGPISSSPSGDHLSPFVAAAGCHDLFIITRMEIEHILLEIEWSTLLFFTGLFILVGAMEQKGVRTAAGNIFADR